MICWKWRELRSWVAIAVPDPAVTATSSAMSHLRGSTWANEPSIGELGFVHAGVSVERGEPGSELALTFLGQALEDAAAFVAVHGGVGAL
jgi:hypothetical protein